MERQRTPNILHKAKTQSHSWRSVALASVFWHASHLKDPPKNLDLGNGSKRIPYNNSTVQTKSWKWQDADEWGHQMYFSLGNTRLNNQNTKYSQKEAFNSQELKDIERVAKQQIERVKDTDAVHEETTAEQELNQQQQQQHDSTMEEESEKSEESEAWSDADTVNTNEADLAMTNIGRDDPTHLLPWDAVTRYETSARFLKSNVLTLRATLLQQSSSQSSLERGSDGPDPGYTRACLERATVAADIALLLDKVRDLLPALNTPLLAAMESAPHHRERRVREAAKNYANHQRATAKRKLKRFKTNASKNRVMYYSARRERAEAEDERRMYDENGRRTKSTRKKKNKKNNNNQKNNNTHNDNTNNTTNTKSTKTNQHVMENLTMATETAELTSLNLDIQRQHRADRLQESRVTSPHLDLWQEDTNTNLDQPGVPGIRKPKLLKFNKLSNRALSPLLASSKTSSNTLLEFSEYTQSSAALSGNVYNGRAMSPTLSELTGSPPMSPLQQQQGEALYYNLGVPFSATLSSSSALSPSLSPSGLNLNRITATVPSHVVKPLPGSLNIVHGPSGFHRRCQILFRAIPHDQRERLVRLCLVEFGIKVSRIRTQRWDDLETMLNSKDFKQSDCTPAPIDATTTRSTIRDLILPTTTHKNLKKTSPMRNGIHLASKKGEYIPYGLRTGNHGSIGVHPGPRSSSAANNTLASITSSPMSKSVVQRQVAKQQRALSRRRTASAKHHALTQSTISKQSFERNVVRNLKDKKWEKEYNNAVKTSQGFMYKRNAPQRKKKKD